MLLSTERLTVRYGNRDAQVRPALRDVTIFVDPGEIVGLIGESGSGKSTLGMALAGMLPRSAHISGGGATWAGTRRAAVIPQAPSLHFSPFLRCGGQVGDVLRARGVARREIPARVMELLGEAGIAEGQRIAEAWPHELSGGELQRVAIARALATEPSLLVADEATSSVDAIHQEGILEMVRTLRAGRGLAVLWITHDFRELVGFADRIVALQDGRVVEETAAGTLARGEAGEFLGRMMAAMPRPAESQRGVCP